MSYNKHLLIFVWNNQQPKSNSTFYKDHQKRLRVKAMSNKGSIYYGNDVSDRPFLQLELFDSTWKYISTFDKFVSKWKSTSIWAFSFKVKIYFLQLELFDSKWKYISTFYHFAMVIIIQDLLVWSTFIFTRKEDWCFIYLLQASSDDGICSMLGILYILCKLNWAS